MITKILVLLFVFSILFLLREGFLLYKAIMKSINNVGSGLDSQSYMTTARLIGIGISLSYIITIIFTGFSL